MKIYILPQVNKPIKFVTENIKSEVDENGNIVITRQMTFSEIAELFDIPVSEVLSEDFKVGIYTL